MCINVYQCKRMMITRKETIKMAQHKKMCFSSFMLCLQNNYIFLYILRNNLLKCPLLSAFQCVEHLKKPKILPGKRIHRVSVRLQHFCKQSK